MKPIRIENWSVVYPAYDGYTAPELLSACLSGDVFDHPRRPGKHAVTTSRIVSASGRVITTASGSVYQLGRPSRAYLAWIKAQGRRYDSKRPVRFIVTEAA